MSLINDMLRDLEQRRDRNADSQQMTSVVTLTPSRRRKRLWGIVGLLVVGVSSGIALFAVVRLHQPPEVVAQEMSPRVETAELPPLAPVPETEAGHAYLTAESEKKSPAENGKAELAALELTVEENHAVFTLHFSALPEYRLDQGTSEKEHLAIYFSDVAIGRRLSVPEFPRQGLLKEFSLKPGPEFLVLLVDLNHEGAIDSVESQARNGSEHLLKIAIRQRSGAEAEVVKEQRPVAVVQEILPEKTEKIPTRTLPDKQENEPDSEPILEKTSTALKVKKTSPYELGIKQLVNGETQPARENFYRALEDHPDLVDARIQLVTLLLQQGQKTAAEQLLREGLEVTPDSPVLRKLLARQLLANMAYREGVALLAAKPQPQPATDQEYFALLAVLLQEDGQYQKALNIYQHLVRLRPQSAIWWFGLGICADQSSDAATARQAYLTALGLPTLRADLQLYARERLERL